MSLQEYRDLVHKKVLEYRVLERLIDSPDWADVWEKLTLEEQKVFIQNARSGQCGNQLHTVFADKHRPLDLWSTSCRELRETARRYGIQYYGRLSKLQLIYQITETQRERTRNSGGEPKANLQSGGPGNLDSE